MSFLQRLAAPFRAFGLIAGLIYLVDRALQRLSPRLGLFAYEFVAQPIVATPLLPPALLKHLRFEILGPDHPDLARMPVPPAVIAKRLRSGSRCLAAYRKDALLGYVWWCVPAYHEKDADCTFELSDPLTSVFDFDLYVLPSQRMGVGFMAVWHGANELLHKEGIKFTCSRISRFNEASRRAHIRLGARILGRALFLRLGSLVVVASTLAPYCGVTLGTRAQARLRIPTPD